MRSTPIGRVRIAGKVVGASFLVLLGVAMPLKHIWDVPLAMRLVGIIHGVLFLIFCAILMDTRRRARWSLGEAMVPLLACQIPFGPWLVDGKLRRMDAEGTPAQQCTPAQQ